VPTPDREGSSLDKLDPTEPIESPIKPADAGEPDAAVDAGAQLGAPDAGQDAQVSDCPATPVCNDKHERVSCDNGTIHVEPCEHGCYAGECTECAPQQDLRCDPKNALQPQVCTVEGEWANDPGQNEGGPCAYLCEKGKCGGECVPEQGVKCEGLSPFTCSREAKWTKQQDCTHICRAGACDTPHSCTSTSLCSEGNSCCRADAVPGGVFLRQSWYDSAVDLHATVAPYQIDRFEVTVGRFRKWLEAYADARPSNGDGANPANSLDHGWDAANWDSQLSSSVDGADGLKAKLAACADTTWSDLERDKEDLPINCVTWYEAFAFCVWDGGRLPTEAEWNFAAAAGAEQRTYPWLDPLASDPLTPDYAIYDATPIAPVGSKRKGDGKFGQADLLGNVSEWVLDWYSDDYTIGPCDNCTELASFGLGRGLRGRSWNDSGDYVDNRDRESRLPQSRSGKVGFRCVRRP
jgi:formylglycine-generating enzyme required for sulfatase activity